LDQLQTAAAAASKTADFEMATKASQTVAAHNVDAGCPSL
jgi:hypothetical protein